MIETIVMVGVIWNAVLQTIWFIWTLKNHSRKHIENNEESPDSEIVTDSILNYTPTPKTKEEVFSGEKKYDATKIKGAFDSFFEEDKK